MYITDQLKVDRLNHRHNILFFVIVIYFAMIYNGKSSRFITAPLMV